MFVGYVGTRMTNLERPVRFYEDALGLKALGAGDFIRAGCGRYLLMGGPGFRTEE